MKHNEYKFKAKMWIYPGKAGWHFVSIPQDISEDIKNNFGDMKRGWGSLPVMVTVGTAIWRTSIFPDKKGRGYLLPIKANVRKKEGIVADNTISLRLEVRV